MYYLGIDLGGTNMAAGICDENGKILLKKSIPALPERDADLIMDDMARLCLDLIAEAGLTVSDIAYAGIASPGIADPDHGEIVYSCNFPTFVNYPICAVLAEKLGIEKVLVANDANAAAKGEAVCGAAKGYSDSVFVTLGTGVGGGIIIGGKVCSGFNYAGGELGHIVIEKDGVPCTCGKSGCTERYCSATAIIRMGREACEKNPGCLLETRCGGDLDKLNAKIIIDAAKEGDAIALSVFNRYANYLTIAVNNIISFLDPDMIVLGGGVSHAGEFLLNAVRERLPKYLMFKTLPYAELRQAKLGNDAGIIGAALLGIEQ